MRSEKMMKRFYIYIIGVVLLLVGCDVETSNNGNLDGFWQMTQMVDKQVNTIYDMCNSGLTWSFQGEMLELRDVKKIHQDIIGDFSYQGGTLSVNHLYIVDRDKGDVSIDDPITYLVPYGIGRLQDQFQVLELSSDQMILESADFLLRFRKY